MRIGVAAVSTGSCDKGRHRYTLSTSKELVLSKTFIAVNEYIHFAVVLLFLIQYMKPMTSYFLIMFLLSSLPSIE